MKLADFVKSLEVGKCVKIETTDENYRVVKLWRTDEGKYEFVFESYNKFEMVKVVFSNNKFETAGKLLDYIAKHFADWLEYEYEICKTRAELKSENAALKKALGLAIEYMARERGCEVCPLYNEENNICAAGQIMPLCNLEILKYFLTKAEKEYANKSQDNLQVFDEMFGLATESVQMEGD